MFKKEMQQWKSGSVRPAFGTFQDVQLGALELLLGEKVKPGLLGLLPEGTDSPTPAGPATAGIVTIFNEAPEVRSARYNGDYSQVEAYAEMNECIESDLADYMTLVAAAMVSSDKDSLAGMTDGRGCARYDAVRDGYYQNAAGTEAQSYVRAFYWNGEEMAQTPCELSDGYLYSETQVPRLYVCNDCKYPPKTDLADQAYNTPDMHAHVVAMHGVPGCGKTTRIIEIAESSQSEGQSVLVLTATRAAKDEFLRRTSNIPCRTLDSYLLNPKYKYDVVCVDESTLSFPGQQISCIAHAGAKKAYLFGDPNQVQAIDFSSANKIDRTPFHDEITEMNTTYRLPADVVFALVDIGWYPSMRTASRVRRSVTTAEYDASAIKYEDGNVLGYTQADKALHGGKTVHGAQGDTYRKTVMCRASVKASGLASKPSYVTVAFTRHTEEFIYYMSGQQDMLASLCVIAEHATEEDLDSVTVYSESSSEGVGDYVTELSNGSTASTASSSGTSDASEASPVLVDADTVLLHGTHYVFDRSDSSGGYYYTGDEWEWLWLEEDEEESTESSVYASTERSQSTEYASVDSSTEVSSTIATEYYWSNTTV